MRVGFAVSEVVPSWTADTPAGCWIEVDLRGWHDDAPSTAGTGWPAGPPTTMAVRRTSLPGQRDGAARVDTDTLIVTGATVTGWQARVTLCRPAGSPTGPVLRSVGAVATGPTSADQGYARSPPRPPPGAGCWTCPATRSACTPASTRSGAAAATPGAAPPAPRWCSPTGAPSRRRTRYAWVEPSGPRPVVVHAARHCYDHAYAGAGNWPFNTAYAGRHGVDAFVTRLRSLVEAEAFVAAGIPLIVSAAFRADEVPGLGYDTGGHLMVLVGFTADGDPVLNDPYAPDDDAVRRTVPRQRFEAVWQRGSGGVAYVLRPASVPLPPPPAQANW